MYRAYDALPRDKGILASAVDDALSEALVDTLCMAGKPQRTQHIPRAQPDGASCTRSRSRPHGCSCRV